MVFERRDSRLMQAAITGEGCEQTVTGQWRKVTR
jgi:hypothetical protein